MTRLLARLAALAIATAMAVTAVPAAAGYHFVTINAPSSPDLLGTVIDDINNNGQVVGFFVTAGPPSDPMYAYDPVYHAFTANADGTGFTEFTRPGSAQLGFSGLNDHGDIVGVAANATGDGTAFVRSASGVYTDIDLAGAGFTALYSEALGINNDGTIVGYYADTIDYIFDIQEVSHGFIVRNGVVSRYDVPDAYGYGTQLISMNTSGFLTGSYLDLDTGERTGFFDSPTLGFQSLAAIGLASEVGDVNESGTFVANLLFPSWYSPTGYDSIGFVAGTDSFPRFIFVPGADDTSAQGLDDQGRIVGFYQDATGVHGYVASYVPEPATWALLLIGFGATGGALRRARVMPAA